MEENNWCLLTSGFGRSAVSVLNLQKEGKIADNKVSLVIYDREPSGAHDLAMSMGIPTVQVKKVHYNERESFEKSLLKECRKHDVDKVFLLGFNYLL